MVLGSKSKLLNCFETIYTVLINQTIADELDDPLSLLALLCVIIASLNLIPLTRNYKNILSYILTGGWSRQRGTCSYCCLSNINK